MNFSFIAIGLAAVLLAGCARDPAVAEATEYAETQLFAEQAQTKLGELEKTGAAKDASRAAAMRDGVARVREQVEKKAPPPEVSRSATATIALVEELLAGAVPEQIR